MIEQKVNPQITQMGADFGEGEEGGNPSVPALRKSAQSADKLRQFRQWLRRRFGRRSRRGLRVIIPV
jgi:hypothetical protein